MNTGYVQEVRTIWFSLFLQLLFTQALTLRDFFSEDALTA